MPFLTLQDGRQMLAHPCPFDHVKYVSLAPDAKDNDDSLQLTGGASRYVICIRCKATGPICMTDHDAIEAWNAHAQRSALFPDILDLTQITKRYYVQKFLVALINDESYVYYVMWKLSKEPGWDDWTVGEIESWIKELCREIGLDIAEDVHIA